MRFLITTALALAAAPPALAQAPVKSAPQPTALPNDIPAARDIPYPGTIRLTVDATDTRRGIFRVKEAIPVAPAARRLTLLYPEWLPGNHAPRGPIDDVSGLRFTAGGQTLTWKRDPVNVYAIHIDLPDGANEVQAEFQYLSPTVPAQGRVVMTSEMLNLQWNLVAFYPAGYFTRQIPVDATAILPAGWRYGTALRPRDAGATTGTIAFQTINFDDLVDSPMFAGRNFRQEQLTPDVRLNIVADDAAELAATPDQIEKHRELVRQAVKLFGSQHYDHYDFLLAISDKQGGIGLEHHRSSENGVMPGYFTKWADFPGRRNLLPHEFTHSWDGKYRRGADAFTPDFAYPMRNSMLWVYEGQTQFWGYVLQARSGLVSKEDTLSAYAMIAALHEKRPGRIWRPLADTTNDPILSARRPQPWVSWQRSEDYYNEGLLVWLDVDAKLRSLTGGKRSLDDFARAFFGPGDRDWGVSTYDYAEVAATLNRIAPFDWAGFLKARVDDIAPQAPLGWLAGSGYRLAYTPEPTAYWLSEEKARKILDLSYSLGLVLDNEAKVTQVIWDGPAFAAGITVGATVLAVDGQAYDADGLKQAIRSAATSGQPIGLLVKKDDRFITASIPYKGGLLYPRLEKTGGGEGTLDRLLARR